MAKSSEIKKLENQVRSLKSEIARLERRNVELVDDRRKYQDWIGNKFGWFVDLLSKSQTPCMKFLVQDTTKLLQITEKFWWESRK